MKIVISDIEYAQVFFGLLIIAWCADDGGDARKMRRLLQDLMPWLIVLLCWAHQINLIVGDLLKLKLPCMKSVSQAVEVVKWFNSHSYALGILAVEQESMSTVILALILPVITRWTAHYCSLRRLLELERPIKASWTKWEKELVECVGKEKNALTKVKEIQEIVEDPSFWRDSRKYVPIISVDSRNPLLDKSQSHEPPRATRNCSKYHARSYYPLIPRSAHPRQPLPNLF